eukprot:scaffold81249_cov67-Phaeocystis_antarctica.AAC.4
MASSSRWRRSTLATAFCRATVASSSSRSSRVVNLSSLERPSTTTRRATSASALAWASGPQSATRRATSASALAWASGRQSAHRFSPLRAFLALGLGSSSALASSSAAAVAAAAVTAGGACRSSTLGSSSAAAVAAVTAGGACRPAALGSSSAVLHTGLILGSGSGSGSGDSGRVLQVLGTGRGLLVFGPFDPLRSLLCLLSSFVEHLLTDRSLGGAPAAAVRCHRPPHERDPPSVDVCSGCADKVLGDRCPAGHRSGHSPQKLEVVFNAEGCTLGLRVLRPPFAALVDSAAGHLIRDGKPGICAVHADPARELRNLLNPPLLPHPGTENERPAAARAASLRRVAGEAASSGV